jgi:hypothetical protein
MLKFKNEKLLRNITIKTWPMLCTRDDITELREHLATVTNPQGKTFITIGRVTIMMPHPERVIRAVQNSHHPKDWDERSPWMRMFENARAWVG